MGRTTAFFGRGSVSALYQIKQFTEPRPQEVVDSEALLLA
jgi:hypothetical protein